MLSLYISYKLVSNLLSGFQYKNVTLSILKIHIHYLKYKQEFTQNLLCLKNTGVRNISFVKVHLMAACFST